MHFSSPDDLLLISIRELIPRAIIADTWDDKVMSRTGNSTIVKLLEVVLLSVATTTIVPGICLTEARKI